MKKTGIFLGSVIICLGTLFGSVQDAAPAAGRRFAVIVGANNGGKDRVRLRYAVSDARSMRGILEELGGIAGEDCLFLPDPDVKTFLSEMDKLRARMEDARPAHSRIEFIFYYSGHSDEKRLLLNEGSILYEVLRETINQTPADVRIAILDSCASGAFTRLKGGKKKPSFLMDEAVRMKGYAFMTSSSSTEASQESDLLKGSFFTHYLASGLRGGADRNEDGRVTLNEAYQFAFSETLAETTQTMNGPQHPNYDIEMSGAGDVVMTDVRNSSTILVLSPEISGRIFIHDQDHRLALELTKSAGQRIPLGLEEGQYRVVKIADGKISESKISLKNGREGTLAAGDFRPSAEQYTTPRGDRAARIQREKPAGNFAGRPITTNLSLPTGSILNRGEVLLGIGPVAYGISGRLQIGADALALITGVFNADARAALIKSEAFAVALGLDWATFRLTADGVKRDFTRLSPFLAVSPRISGKTTLHFGGRYAEFRGKTDIKAAERSNDVDGTLIYSGLDLNLSGGTKLLTEIGYDLTFDIYRSGAAFLFGGRTFRLKLGLQYFKPRDFDGYSRFIAGIWWRFGG